MTNRHQDAEYGLISLKQALRIGISKAWGNLMGASKPFGALDWMLTLPLDWQDDVEAVIAYVYHYEQTPDVE